MKKQSVSIGKEWLKNQTRPYNARIVFLAILSFIISALAIVFAYLVRYLLNAATSGKSQTVLFFAILLTGLLLLRIALQTWKNYQAEKYRSGIVCGLRVRTFSSILRSDYASVQKYHSGDLQTRLTADIDEIATDTVGLVPAIVGLVVQSVGAVVALMTIDWIFTGIYVASGVVLFLLSTLLRKYVKKYHKEYLAADGETRGYLQEASSNITTVKAYSAEEKSTDKARAYAGVYHKKRMQRNRLNAITGVFFSLISNLGLIFALIWCSISVLSGFPDYGAILSIVLLLMQLKQPFTAFSSLLPVYYAAIASAERLSEIDDLPKETMATKNTAQIYSNMQAIVLEDVSFDYDRELIFDGANAKFEKGKTVCITGSSGSGKSTLFRLLLRVFSAKQGKIAAIGVDNEVVLDESTRGLFAYVPQGNFLFSGTIYENLTFYADECVGDTQVKQALEVADATFVFDLPEGLETPLLERGGGLSEGQLQRLAIARAILSNRPILLLDEATSALDEKTEKTVLENIAALKDKTCLIVTHRPAALAIADSILRVDGGQITTIR